MALILKNNLKYMKNVRIGDNYHGKPGNTYLQTSDINVALCINFNDIILYVYK